MIQFIFYPQWYVVIEVMGGVGDDRNDGDNTDKVIQANLKNGGR